MSRQAATSHARDRAGRFDLIIFDCDGVLVDSEPIANRVLTACLNEIGLPITYEECVRRFVGRAAATFIAEAERELGRPVPDGFGDNLLTRTLAAFRTELQPMPGIFDLLDAVQVPICVASSSLPIRLQTALDLTGLLDRFDGHVFSASMVARGKPFPDLFLYAANTMGAAPERCAVIEDSAVGVQAGVAAGMTVFGFAAAGNAEALSAAGARVFIRMSELPALLT